MCVETIFTEKYMKKFLLLILTLVCITSSMLFFGCSGTYYTLTYAKVDGVTYVSEVKTGAKVLDGYTVTFSISLDQAVVGEPEVYANDTLLTANADGKYSFKMKRDTEVKVIGVELQRKYSITFDKGVERISYTSPDGDAESGFEVIGGKTGTTYDAGFCLVLYSKNSEGQEIISIVFKADGRHNLYLLMNEILRKFAK